MLWRSNTDGTMPECRICSTGNAQQDLGNDIPIGLDEDEYLTCGCHYSDAMLKAWQAQKHPLNARVHAAVHIVTDAGGLRSPAFLLSNLHC